MHQQIRIFIYFGLIMAIALVLSKYLPISYQPANWRISQVEEPVIADIDSVKKTPSEVVDSIEKVVEAPNLLKDTIIEKHFLTCSSLFLDQLNKLHQELVVAKDSNRNIRILHYGDSQIEGDRITARIRQSFQNRFGGSGPGLTTVYDPQRLNPSVWIDSKGDWKIHNVYSRRNKLPNKQYGLMGRTASLQASTKGEFRMSPSKWAESHAANYQKIRLFIVPHKDTVLIKGQIKETEVINDSLVPSSDLTEINWVFEQLSPRLKIELESKQAIHILGCALDSTCGVSVDNIALRGQSSPMFHQTNADLFTAMGEHLNIRLVMLQFGTNVIPTVDTNYHFYKVQLAKQFDLLKKYLPGIPVIVIGITDAAHFSDGKLVAYDHLHRIRDAQKAVTLEYDFAFFDLYEAMGGSGSIIEWSKKSPRWALTDYIHLSRRGGEEAASYITKALWQHFNEYEKMDSSLVTQNSKL
ncbi:MAG: GDSL-type esterase/lipase family protein [Carboxylicivirga sp.]|jgi:lysophospholipase L1-like esterase|nr:GDSL-type esterase/lipase family protein [Carboxylicivirga sp.]